MRDWQDVVTFACGLPGVSMAPFYGTPCPKVNGKALASPGREAGSFALFTSGLDEKHMLIETDPATFWQTDHYRNYPAVLASYGTDAHERLETWLTRRWWDCATKQQRAAWGERP
ncbi:hypothetical protein [Novosphingobium sp. FSW06-99]|uniref:hypothetical protein n=1 Tax=Novosphingobium sp. FSW06-99 TaxID=1739113 RepID=UPI00076C407E|nr:hypothetical protein [Novosphingobium sp. FSW06-99]KUR76350.1 hypothetical protein AQZ49_11710 [Novosphingobium sp. FSW06-99]